MLSGQNRLDQEDCGTKKITMPTFACRLFWIFGLLGALGLAPAVGQDLDAGKTGAQLFAQDCTGCHKSPQGLIKTAHAFSLNSFLRQHYTTSSRSAAELAAYLNSVANSARLERERQKQKQKPEERTARRSPSLLEGLVGGEAARADGDQRAARKQGERPSARTNADPRPAEDTGGDGLRSGRTATAARGQGSLKPAESAVSTNMQPASDVKGEPQWTAATEALLPPPVDAAEPSGLEPGAFRGAGRPVTAASQPAFSSPVP
jgi:hypothetical protein